LVAVVVVVACERYPASTIRLRSQYLPCFPGRYMARALDCARKRAAFCIDYFARQTETKVKTNRFAFAALTVNLNCVASLGHVVQRERGCYLPFELGFPIDRHGIATYEIYPIAIAYQRRSLFVQIEQRVQLSRTAGLKPIDYDARTSIPRVHIVPLLR
jgi:hypothetical protein